MKIFSWRRRWLLMIAASLTSMAAISAYLHYKLDPADASTGKGVFVAERVEQEVLFKAAAPSSVHSYRQSEYGYVMALSYVDQMTGSVANLLSMQCWAHTLGKKVKVVEPFLLGSTLGNNLSFSVTGDSVLKEGNTGIAHPLKLSDVFDRMEWQRRFATNLFVPLIDWVHFIEDAPRKLIFVGRKCSEKKEGKCMECAVRTDRFFDTIKVFMIRYNFQVVRVACYPSLMSEDAFKKLIYARFSPQEVVVIFNSWGGVQPNNHSLRVGVTGKNVELCGRDIYMLDVPASERVLADAKNYTQTYLTGPNNKEYISVMVHMEQFAIAHQKFQGMSNATAEFLITTCFKNLINTVNFLKKQHNVDRVFLTVDCRSGCFSKNKNNSKELSLKKMLGSSVEILYKMLYQNTSSLEEWDISFKTVSSSTNPGYIAVLQKVLAVRGLCLLLVGGGASQSAALKQHYLYRKQHNSAVNCGAVKLPTC